jgi:hypothetical protein
MLDFLRLSACFFDRSYFTSLLLHGYHSSAAVMRTQHVAHFNACLGLFLSHNNEYLQISKQRSP